MPWAGKGIRDFAIVVAALGILTIGISGFLLLRRPKSNFYKPNCFRTFSESTASSSSVCFSS